MVTPGTRLRVDSIASPSPPDGGRGLIEVAPGAGLLPGGCPFFGDPGSQSMRFYILNYFDR